MPNPSIERTHNGRLLQALISFWALRSLPLCAHSLESAAPCRCIEKSKLNHRQRHTKAVLVQRSSEYIAIMSFVGQASLSHAWRWVHAKGLRANPSFKRTRSGKPALAFISFWAKAGLPPRAG